MKRLSALFTAPLLLALAPLAVSAETTDFGGYAERYKGAGDKIPPQCQVNAPSAASEDFVVKWNCVDDNPNNTPPEKMRARFWVRKPSDTRWHILDHFLGFPASVLVDRGMLGIAADADFKSGLPISLRIEAWDTAGNTTFSQILSVSDKDTTLDTCSVNIVAAATESSGDTTGLPSQEVTLTDAPVITTRQADDKIRITSASIADAEPCEIEGVCADSEQVSFDLTVTVAEDQSATANFIATPGVTQTELTGTAKISGVVLDSVSLSGSGTADGRDAQISVSCSK